MRILPFLIEDAKQDKIFRDKARKIYQDLIEYLENSGDYYTSKRIGAYVTTSQFTDVIDDELTIEWTQTRVGKGDASYTTRGSGAMKKKVLRLFVMDKRFYSDSEERRNEMIQGLKDNSDVFIHELIHYFDDLRAEEDLEDVIQYKSQGKDPKTYYSDPVEVNAFFQSALAEFEGFIEDDEHFEFMMEMRWKKDFRNFKEWIFDKVLPEEFMKHLSGDQKKRLINRLYGYWKQLEERYQNLKGDEA